MAIRRVDREGGAESSPQLACRPRHVGQRQTVLMGVTVAKSVEAVSESPVCAAKDGDVGVQSATFGLD